MLTFAYLSGKKKFIIIIIIAHSWNTIIHVISKFNFNKENI